MRSLLLQTIREKIPAESSIKKLQKYSEQLFSLMGQPLEELELEEVQSLIETAEKKRGKEQRKEAKLVESLSLLERKAYFLTSKLVEKTPEESQEELQKLSKDFSAIEQSIQGDSFVLDASLRRCHEAICQVIFSIRFPIVYEFDRAAVERNVIQTLLDLEESYANKEKGADLLWMQLGSTLQKEVNKTCDDLFSIPFLTADAEEKAYAIFAFVSYLEEMVDMAQKVFYGDPRIPALKLRKLPCFLQEELKQDLDSEEHLLGRQIISYLEKMVLQ